MSLHFLVKFVPQLDQDYQHTFTLTTDNYSFDVSLIGKHIFLLLFLLNLKDLLCWKILRLPSILLESTNCEYRLYLNITNTEGIKVPKIKESV